MSTPTAFHPIRWNRDIAYALAGRSLSSPSDLLETPDDVAARTDDPALADAVRSGDERALYDLLPESLGAALGRLAANLLAAAMLSGEVGEEEPTGLLVWKTIGAAIPRHRPSLWGSPSSRSRFASGWVRGALEVGDGCVASEDSLRREAAAGML